MLSDDEMLRQNRVAVEAFHQARGPTARLAAMIVMSTIARRETSIDAEVARAPLGPISATTARAAAQLLRKIQAGEP
jgi:hypothetical protein